MSYTLEDYNRDRPCRCGHGRLMHTMGAGDCEGTTAICDCEGYRPTNFHPIDFDD